MQLILLDFAGLPLAGTRTFFEALLEFILVI